MASSSGKAQYGRLQTGKESEEGLGEDVDPATALSIGQYEITAKKESLQRRYDTCCSIISTASEHCGKTREFALGIFTASLPIILGALISAACTGNCTRTFCSMAKTILYVYAGLMIALLLVFLIVDLQFYRRQAIYRVLKKKIQADLFAGNFEESFEDEELKYQFTLNATKGEYLHCQNVCGLFKETLPFAASILLAVFLLLFAIYQV